MKLYLATGNIGKAEEIEAVLRAGASVLKVVPAAAVSGMPPVRETKDTFSGNARLKAEALKAILPTEAWVLADDSGLVVDVLGGSPGVTSSRYAGEGVTAAENNRKLLEELNAIPDEKRTARFVCCLALLEPGGQSELFRGICEGTIARAISGEGGFGYDPLFKPKGYEQTFGELGAAVKDKISHRARALKKLLQWLRRSPEFCNTKKNLKMSFGNRTAKDCAYG